MAPSTHSSQRSGKSKKNGDDAVVRRSSEACDDDASTCFEFANNTNIIINGRHHHHRMGGGRGGVVPIVCGRGDKKTKKGKRFKGSYGNARPKKEKKIERIKDRVEVPRSTPWPLPFKLI
uniref:30S ribosomal protein S31, mitochondrial n=1 Tax=Fagus sylvatica TaxID=28930 RepID=A0A2N9GWG8_FAGSY